MVLGLACDFLYASKRFAEGSERQHQVKLTPTSVVWRDACLFVGAEAALFVRREAGVAQLL